MLPKDPHLLDSKLFGLPGLTVTRGGDTFSLCTNTFGPPHSLCKISSDEIKHRADIIASGEFGKRGCMGKNNEKNRLGFAFKDTKVPKIIKLKEKDDPELKKLLCPSKVNFFNTMVPLFQDLTGEGRYPRLVSNFLFVLR